MDDFTVMDWIIMLAAVLFGYWSYLLFAWIWEDPFFNGTEEEQDDD